MQVSGSHSFMSNFNNGEVDYRDNRTSKPEVFASKNKKQSTHGPSCADIIHDDGNPTQNTQ